MSFDEFSIVLGGKSISLADWDHEIDLAAILGNPLETTKETLGDGADTFAGTHIKKMEYEGLELTLMSPKSNGKTFWISRMDVTGNQYLTARGVKVGDSLEKLKKVYSEVQRVPDGTTDPNNGPYAYSDGNLNYIQFEVENGNINRISIYNEMP